MLVTLKGQMVNFRTISMWEKKIKKHKVITCQTTLNSSETTEIPRHILLKSKLKEGKPFDQLKINWPFSRGYLGSWDLQFLVIVQRLKWD